eukprot:COSAG02_NODE_15309_length_1182_cov_1.669437_1_plen_52_part_10
MLPYMCALYFYRLGHLGRLGRLGRLGHLGRFGRLGRIELVPWDKTMLLFGSD